MPLYACIISSSLLSLYKSIILRTESELCPCAAKTLISTLRYTGLRATKWRLDNIKWSHYTALTTASTAAAYWHVIGKLQSTDSNTQFIIH